MIKYSNIDLLLISRVSLREKYAIQNQKYKFYVNYT